jgi:hypothetical protein
VVGQRSYDILVLPAEVENLNGPTLELLAQYLEAGGRVICLSEGVRFVDGRASDAPGKLAAAQPTNWVLKPADGAINDLIALCGQDIQFADLDGDRTMFFHQRRVLADAELVFLANVSPDRALSGAFVSRGKSAELWDPFTGKVSPHACQAFKGRVTVKFDLPPAGSAVFCLRSKAAGQTKLSVGANWSRTAG